jgi:hypothetical protein
MDEQNNLFVLPSGLSRVLVVHAHVTEARRALRKGSAVNATRAYRGTHVSPPHSFTFT